jgi:transcriptional regulator with XRE-family HTH domain
MKAIQRLERAGYTRQQIAAGAGIGMAALAMYRRGDRFPSQKSFVCLVEMAELKGLTLAARDFIDIADTCENSVSKPARGKGKKKI